METVHHVHADDVAQAFEKAINRRSTSIGESFHVVSPKALTLRAYASAMAEWFGREANIRFLAWDDWKKNSQQNDADATWDHIAN
jgi:nucleoside-diphosphate-sugar epimerase